MIKHIEHKNLIPWHYYYVHNAKLKEKIRNEDVEILQWNGTNWNLKLAIIPSKTYLAIAEVPEVDLSLYETNPRHYGSLHCNHCDKYDSEFYIDTVTVDCVMRIGDKLYIRGYSFDQYSFRIFFTKEEVDEYHKASKFNSLQMCCYANKATANYALKLIKEEREKRNA